MSARKRAKSPSPAASSVVKPKVNSTPNKDTKAVVKVETYQSLFNKIDTDGSGTIDASELFSAVSKLYPEHRFTRSEIGKMFDEADVNHDGAVSYKEFCHILNHAEGKANAWGKLEQSLWHRAAKNVSDLSQLVVSKTAKDFARSHSYECADSGHLVPTAGIRFIAEIVGDCFVLCVAISIGLCSYLNDNARYLRGTFMNEIHSFEILRDSAKSARTESLDFAQKAKNLTTVIFIVGIALNLFVRFFGVTVGFHLFGLETVNKASKKTANFFQMILFDPLTIIFLAITCYQHFCDDFVVFNKLSEWVTYVLYADVLFCLYLLVVGTYPTEDLFGLQVVVQK
jgi:hypothetical protein